MSSEATKFRSLVLFKYRLTTNGSQGSRAHGIDGKEDTLLLNLIYNSLSRILHFRDKKTDKHFLWQPVAGM